MKKDSSWESVSSWYDSLVSTDGHYFHQHVIFPKLLPLITGKNLKVLDLGCGQGPLARKLPNATEYLGIDLSPSLIQFAKSKNPNPKIKFMCADATKPLKLEKDFTDAFMILCLQNMKNPEGALKNAYKALAPQGRLFLVLNHPAFRIPRQSHWGVDEIRKIQFRRLDCYLSELEIPIQKSPSMGEKSATTLSFHKPLSKWSELLFTSQFLIEKIEEWTSDKVSTGKKARMEDRARKEFPLFLTFICQKR
ncbi:MAG: class I SAM-dependent methyltransferase [Simkaniaceae bacterium]